MRTSHYIKYEGVRDTALNENEHSMARIGEDDAKNVILAECANKIEYFSHSVRVVMFLQHFVYNILRYEILRLFKRKLSAS